jgi:hypothetical protein
MSWGTALSAYGAISSASAQKAAGDSNAAYLGRESRIASGTALSEEAITRQGNAVKQGNLTAAAAQAGISTGTSSQAVARQSAINQELDALNVRYGGVIRSSTYAQQAGNVQAAGNTAATSSALRAGGALISGIGSGYNGNYSLASYAT